MANPAMHQMCTLLLLAWLSDDFYDYQWSQSKLLMFTDAASAGLPTQQHGATAGAPRGLPPAQQHAVFIPQLAAGRPSPQSGTEEISLVRVLLLHDGTPVRHFKDATADTSYVYVSGFRIS